ncbi:MAG TPA: DUF1844 domain-containing protein [Candidatus Latescibacteria bacterium]|nr:DUF1844 domain-containing protein [Candidatus Latescibacterota bacterium]
MEEKDRNSQLFFSLVAMFQAAAMQQMGKLINPITGKVERDMEQARFSIDILGMLQEKTQGNLTEEERRFLDHVLFELRMNYVDEVEKDKAEEKSEEGKEEDVKVSAEARADTQGEDMGGEEPGAYPGEAATSRS